MEVSQLECCESHELDWQIVGSLLGEGHGSGRAGGMLPAGLFSVRCRVRSGGGYGRKRGVSEFAEAAEAF